MTLKGEGTLEFTNRTLTQNHFDADEEKWTEDWSKVLDSGKRAELAGSLTAKAYLKITAGLAYVVNFLEVEFAVCAEVALKGVFDDAEDTSTQATPSTGICVGIEVSIYYQRTTKLGLWTEFDVFGQTLKFGHQHTISQLTTYKVYIVAPFGVHIGLLMGDEYFKHSPDNCPLNKASGIHFVTQTTQTIEPYVFRKSLFSE